MIAWLVVFLAMLGLDLVFTRWAIASAELRAIPAGLWAAAIVPFNAVVTIAYVGDHWLVIPAVAGAFVGTALAVNMKRRTA